MGYFSDIAYGTRTRVPGTVREASAPLLAPVQSSAPAPAPVPASAPAPAPVPAPAPAAAPAQASAPAPATAPVSAPIPAAVSEPAPVPEPASVSPKPAPVPDETPAQVHAPVPDQAPASTPVIDLSADADAADEAERKRAHERAEAERKAAFDAKQAEKRAAAQAELDRIEAMPDADAQAAARNMIASGIERITRRNMKEAVAAYLSERAMSDPSFAKACLRPGKTLQAVFKRINEKAREYLKDEAEAAGETPTGAVGGDVPDDVVYGWAADFMLEPPAEPDEKFVPKPYVPSARKASKAKTAKKKPEKKPAPEKPKAPAMEQASLF